MFNLIAYVDGGSLGNPGPAGIGVVIDGAENGTIKITKPIGRQDNNVAEYLALLEALQCAVDLGGQNTSRVFGFGSGGQTDDRGIHLPEHAALFTELDL